VLPGIRPFAEVMAAGIADKSVLRNE